MKRVQHLDRCLMPWGKDGDPELPLPRFSASRTLGIEEVGLPSLSMRFNQELRALLDLSAVKVNELTHEIIERGPRMVRCLSNTDGDKLRKAIVQQLETARYTGPYAYTPFECGIDFDLQPPKMFFCPTYSRERIIKRWLALIGRGPVNQLKT